MRATIRAVMTVICSVGSFYFLYWMAFSTLFSGRTTAWVPLAGSAVCAVIVGRYVWRRTASLPQGLASSIVLGGVVVGAVGFVGGFVGSIIFAPDANQGPLLGLFITGPLGALVGAVGGAVVWLGRRPHEKGRRPTRG